MARVYRGITCHIAALLYVMHHRCEMYCKRKVHCCAKPCIMRFKARMVESMADIRSIHQLFLDWDIVSTNVIRQQARRNKSIFLILFSDQYTF
jgi:hypothetical protein